MTRHELETTSQIPRDELLGLLNTMASIEHQRITAPIAAVSPPPELPVYVTPPGTGVSIVTPRPTLFLFRRRFPVVVISFAVTLALGLTAMMVA